MKRLLVVAATLALLLALSIPASAQGPLPCTPVPNGNGSATCTIQMRDVAFGPFPVPPTACPDGSTVPGGVVTGTFATAVFHITINRAGDVWATNTEEGTFTLVSSGSPVVTFTGHLAGWFGESLNNQNFVIHSTFNVTATGSDGSHVTLHMVSHWSTSASGTMVLMFDKVTC
jgi:uncharacterized Zn-binding protein involved in type VI secretion